MKFLCDLPRRAWLFLGGALVAAQSALAAAPDLIIWPDRLNPRTVFQSFDTNDCEVVEGCALSGQRRYLNFTTETRNIGDADLVLGNPASNPNFIYALCHQHYHFTDFADYQLVNSAGEPVAIGLKAGFCLLDSEPWRSGAAVDRRFSCSNQGIQEGWADLYTRDLSCQWVDITGLPSGIYRLEIEVNPAGRLPERTRTNNLTYLSVYIDDPCSGPPPNDNFASAITFSNRIETVFGSTGCATTEPDEPNQPGTGTNSIWFRWIAPYSGAAVITTEGSTVDTMLAVYLGAGIDALTLHRSDDNDGDRQTSRVSFNAVSNRVYHIAVTGVGNMAGGVALNINPDGNDLFANALLLPGASGTIAGRNLTARRETGEPRFPGTNGLASTNSVWFCGRVPVSGLLRFDTEGSNFDTLLAIYTGSRITNLVLVSADNNAGTNRTSRLYFQAEAGTNYWVAVDGVAGQSGFFRLNWGAPGPGPSFGNPRLLADGSRELNLNGSVGDRYRVETTGDFLTWSNWLRLTNLTGRIQFIDTVNTEARRRFYRAVLVP